jgi:hypothetical protein
MTHEEKVEQAITANDVETLVKYFMAILANAPRSRANQCVFAECWKKQFAQK